MNRMALHVRTLSLLLLVFLPVAAQIPTAQLPGPAQPSPEQPFEAIHLLWVDTQQPHAEKRMRTALAGLNDAIRKAGCITCVYHLWRVSEGSPGTYNYMQQSKWPSRAMYDKFHNNLGYATASQAWATLRSVVTQEVYVRQTEVPGEAQLGITAELTSSRSHNEGFFLPK